MLELLRCISSGEREFALKDVADKTGLAPSTVHRLLDPWVQYDLLERAGPKAYRMGPELFRVASLVTQKFELNRLALPVLEQLWKQWQETACFCLLNPSSRTVTVAETIASPHPLKYVLAPHSVISLAWGSLGRAILAHLPAPDIEAAMQHDRRGPLSGKPLPPQQELEKELGRIRNRGYALYEDAALNVAGVSAPVLQANVGVIGSLGVIMPASRFGKPVKSRLPDAVVAAARQLSGTLGFD
jgi:IclR family transcriptional regulator, acetate operon repressor